MLNGVGAAGTPILVGYLMKGLGPSAFLYFLASMMAAITVYAMYRMTVRPSPAVDGTSPIAPYSMVSGTQVAAEIAQEIARETAEEQASAESETA